MTINDPRGRRKAKLSVRDGLLLYVRHIGTSPFTERTEELRKLDACAAPSREALIRWGDEGGQLYVSTAAHADLPDRSPAPPR